MPEYLAPGVYIEETSFRAKTIEGVSTSTAGFVGPTLFGPTEGEPELLTSFSDFERIYGGIDQLQYSPVMHNYMAHAVRAFFEEGGSRLYVSRAYTPPGSGTGRASTTVTNDSVSPAEDFIVEVRHPGAVANNVAVNFSFKLGQNVLTQAPIDPADESSGSVNVLRGATEYDLVMVTQETGTPPGTMLTGGTLYWVQRTVDPITQRPTHCLRRGAGADCAADASAVALTSLTAGTDQVRGLTVSVTVGPLGRFGDSQSWEGLSFHPNHLQGLTKVFSETPVNRATLLFTPIRIPAQPTGGISITNGVELAEVMLAQASLLATGSPPETVLDALLDPESSAAARGFQVNLTGGSDGTRPNSTGDNGYEGDDGGTNGQKSGLRAFEDLEDISIVAAPGSSHGFSGSYASHAASIQRQLISHCERMRYRVAVLDSGNGQLPSEVRALRGQLDSTHAALYYPWVRVVDPLTQEQIDLPPSGFVSGIWARNDVEHGVHKAPANEVVRSALGFEALINKAQQDVLNPEGINCLRFFEGRGYRVWGARTISSDSEWKYVNVRRYFAYLERSIELGTQWVVFENNHHPLWARVRGTIEDFLFSEWKNERIMGTKPEEAYFVRCDRSTMTQNDIDNGRLVCLIGVAPVKPAEFVIFRIGQFTADSQS